MLRSASKHQLSWSKYRHLQQMLQHCSKSSTSTGPQTFTVEGAIKSTCSSLQKKDFVDIGQPTPYTHPHLFTSTKHATPGVTHIEYATRRRNLMILLSQTYSGKQHNNHVLIIPANNAKIMTNDIPYPFHQDNDFLYLTGVNEPDAVLIMSFNRSSSDLECILFVKPKDPQRELWDGPLVGVDAAQDYFNFDQALPLSSLSGTIKERFGDGGHAMWLNNDKTQNNITKLINSSPIKKKAVFNIGHNLQMLRLIKSDAEIEIMKQSASIATKAFSKVIQNTKPGLLESHLHALLEFECRIHGAQRLSFPPVVAGGNRANTLHYVNNTHILSDGDLVLMDGGCEYNGYASDITRTWPVNGIYTEEQKSIYEMVLSVQKICLEACRPGVSMDQLHHIMLMSLGERLQEIGFIPQNLKEDQLKRSVYRFCPHHVGHYLGMDTHDTPMLHRRLPLQHGMAFTLEPGLYIPNSMSNVPQRYRGIGIRIEDDILMTSDGPYVLTGELPKEIKDIETLISTSSTS